MAESQKDILNRLFKEYNLVYDDDPDNKANDVYKHKHYTIITRAGIQKIERRAGITISMNPVDGACGKDFFTVEANGTRLIDGKVVNYQTFGSASEFTSKNQYYPEMAEKRARSRIVLTLAGLYEEGLFGEDEADDFQDSKPKEVTQKVTYKGN